MASPSVQPQADYADEPFPDTPNGSSLTATRDHLTRLAERVIAAQAKADALAAHLVEGEEAYLHRLSSAYAAGEFDLDALYRHFMAWRDYATSGKQPRWDAVFPNATYQRMLRNEYGRARWEGVEPYAGESRPIPGISVVYVLYDASDVVCYIGSTKSFSNRMRSHRSSGKQWARWEAFRCRDRAHAYARERDLLHQHKPYLNQAVPR